jgi:hypothetical protein
MNKQNVSGSRGMKSILIAVFLLLLTASSGFENSVLAQDSKSSGLSIATFDVDATPPPGSYMAYGKVINTWDMSLRARGIVLLGAGKPIVLCSVDWIGIANDSQDEFKKVMAEAAGTDPDHVALHTVHQHDAPICDFGAEKYLKESGLDPLSYESTFTRKVMQNIGDAIRTSVNSPQPFDQIGLGEAPVYMVASNRRIMGPDGKVRATRYTTCKDSSLRAEPEGLIDPVVSVVSFWNKGNPVAVLSYYAVHPQSYYLTGLPNPDFPGLARFYRQLEVPEALHIHFNGAGGNLGAGKYNDGSHENRGILAVRLADGMKRAWESTSRENISPADIAWNIEQVALPPAKSFSGLGDELRKNSTNPLFISNNVSKVIWYNRCISGKEINICCLSMGKARILHMPGELFVEYQLAAKAERPDLFVAMAAYGDYGPEYICTDIAYEQGGYEGSDASGVAPGSEKILMTAIKNLLHR